MIKHQILQRQKAKFLWSLRKNHQSKSYLTPTVAIVSIQMQLSGKEEASMPRVEDVCWVFLLMIVLRWEEGCKGSDGRFFCCWCNIQVSLDDWLEWKDIACRSLRKISWTLVGWYLVSAKTSLIPLAFIDSLSIQPYSYLCSASESETRPNTRQNQLRAVGKEH